jgi:hypothetical protein
LSKYKIGEVVIIIKNTTDHEFEIGEKVKISSFGVDGDIFTAKKLDGSEEWCISEDEVTNIAE